MDPAAAAPVPTSEESSWFGRNIYVRNLPPVNPFTCEMPSESHVHILFSRFGPIEKLRVVRDRATNLPVGHALILFKNTESAQAAINYVNTHFNAGMFHFVKPSAMLWLPKEVFNT